MNTAFRLLFIAEHDTEIHALVRLLGDSGSPLEHQHIRTLSELESALIQEWDLVLCDCRSAAIDGHTVLGRIRRQQSGLCVIALLENSNLSTAMALIEAGADYTLDIDHLPLLAPLMRRKIQVIADSKSVTLALDEQRQEQTAIISHVPSLLLLLDKNLMVRKIGGAVTHLREIPVESLMGLHCCEAIGCIHATPETRGKIANCSSCGICFAAEKLKPSIHEVRIQTMHNGSLCERLLSVSITSIASSGPLHTLLSLSDITDQRQVDKLSSLGTLVASIAHEINNPTNFISLNAPLLQDVWSSARPLLDRLHRDEGEFSLGGLAYAEMREQMPRIFDGIRCGVDRIRTIVAELKNYARQDDGVQPQAVDLNQVVQAALPILAGHLRHCTTQFTLDCCPDLPPVYGHFRRLEQVVINLVQNACEALSDASQSITVSTRWDATSRRVYLEVADLGRGMGSDVLPQITKPFFTTRSSSGGTGLGLSIVNSIVKEHHGHMSFASVLGKGTTITVALPMA